jgi:hypothetical protein
LTITLPNAQKAGVGETILFNNQGSNIFIVKDAGGTQVVSLNPGELWQIYLTSNSSSAGTWESLQYGATTSNANASALAGTGIVAVGALLSQSVPSSSISSNYSLLTTDRARMFIWTSSGAGTITLPAASALGGSTAGWFFYLRNSGGGAIVITPQGSNKINSLSSLSLQPNDSAIVACISTSEFCTIGLGKSAIFAFDYTSIDVSGSGNYTLGALSSSELNKIAYTFTGTLTGNRTIIVPTTIQQYWVGNSTAVSAYTLTVKTSAGLGVQVGTGTRRILYCNGTDVVVADLNASSLTVPVLVSQGGTGATASGTALVNLGGGTTGISVFQSATASVAYAALGVAPSGIIDGGTF